MRRLTHMPTHHRATLLSATLHLTAVLLLVTTLHSAPQLAPFKLPGSAHGTRLLTYYTPGSLAPSTSTATLKKPHTPTTASAATTAPTPTAAPTPSAPAAETGTGRSTESGLGEGEIKIALQKVFPHPEPDLSSMPHNSAGDVILDATVDATGKISVLTIVKGLGPAIDNQVIATVRQWSYTPATRNGIPIPSEQELHFHYERS